MRRRAVRRPGRIAASALVGALLGVVAGCGEAPARGEGRVRLAATHTLSDAGLLDPLVAACTQATGVRIDALVLPTGQALAVAARGDADVVLTHDRVAEEQFVAQGHGTGRTPTFWSRFLVVGPPVEAGDEPDWERAYRTIEERVVRPAAGDGATEEAVHPTFRFRPSAAAYLRCLARYGGAFVSRGDDSGTHRRERALLAGTTIPWRGYVESGQGMAATLRIADERRAAALTDEPTFRRLAHDLRLVPKVEGDYALRNEYGVLLAGAAPSDAARRVHAWLGSKACAEVAVAFRIRGARVFHAPDEPTLAPARERR